MIHAALLLRLQLTENLPAKPAGGGGIQVALAIKQGPLQSKVATPAKGAAKNKPQRGSKPNPQPHQPVSQPTTKTKRDVVSAAQPKPKPKPQSKFKPKSQPKSKPKSKPEPKPKPKPKPKPQPKPKPKSRSQPKSEPQPQPQPKPKPKPKPKSKPTAAPKTQSKSTRRSATPPAPVKHVPPSTERDSQRALRKPNAARPGGASNRPTTAPTTSNRTQPVSTGTVADTPPDYRAGLRADLAKHKTYPQRARLERLQGTVVLYFVMDRNGNVLQWEIRKSSGHPLLDKAVEQMIKSANPLPPLPSSVSMQRLRLTVPVTFRLR